jgi:hypothetical protein
MSSNPRDEKCILAILEFKEKVGAEYVEERKTED